MRTIINLGCKLNQYEGYCLLEKFRQVDNLVVVNTCCVTKQAEAKSLRKLRFALKKYPHCTIIATGCACRLAAKKFSAAHRVIDNVERNQLIQGIFPLPDRSRYFLKIQDGCNDSCTYCIVTRVRDTIESKPIEEIKEEVCWARTSGYNEIVLVGANIGLYGIDVERSLVDVLKALQTVPQLPRIRLSSIEPKYVSADLISCLKDLPFCPHFHIPLQSANAMILKRMKRGYTVDHLSQIVELISSAFSDCAIGGDVIVGFPGEGQKEFHSTYSFVETHPLTHLHVFPYSVRPGTVASAFGDPVPHEEKKKRLWLLKALIEKKNYEFRKTMLGKTLRIIVEKDGRTTSGITGNYIRVELTEDHPDRALRAVTITDVTWDKTFGTVIQT